MTDHQFDHWFGSIRCPISLALGVDFPICSGSGFLVVTATKKLYIKTCPVRDVVVQFIVRLL